MLFADFLSQIAQLGATEIRRLYSKPTEITPELKDAVSNLTQQFSDKQGGWNAFHTAGLHPILPDPTTDEETSVDSLLADMKAEEVGGFEPRMIRPVPPLVPLERGKLA